MPNYTIIPNDFRLSYLKKFDSVGTDKIAELAEDDPVIFAYYFLGKKVRLHQAYIVHRLLKAVSEGKKRLAMCLARQLGKSVVLAIFLIWSAWFNKFPTSILKITSCYIISRDDSASIELLDKIRGVLSDGDKQMKQFTGSDNWFSGSLKEPNNTHQITFLNGCFIKSIPPTGQILGKSASIVVIDEAHRLECEDPDKFYNQFVVPTTAETGGIIILSSSPEGLVGFFYEAIDPDGKKMDNPYETIWFPWEIWDDDTAECSRYRSFVLAEKERLSIEGRLREWQQEYEALFTVTQSSFFLNSDIEENLSDNPQMYEWKDTPSSVGYDYGLNTSRSVITIRTTIGQEIIQLFQYRAPAGFDNNLLTNPEWEHSIQRLKNRYNLFAVVVDDSAPGDQTNRWLEQNSGIPVHKHNFRSDQAKVEDGINRNNVAYSYRANLKRGILKIPRWNIIQQTEMKTVQEIAQKILISIKSPSGSLCDTFDSDMMACIPFLDMAFTNEFSFDGTKNIDEEKPNTTGNPRVDPNAFRPLNEKECRELADNLANRNLDFFDENEGV